MTNQKEAEGPITIQLEGEDGHSFNCQVLHMFEFEDKEYALLLNLGETATPVENPEEQGSLVIMRYFERDNQSVFQTIESDEEFDRVKVHVEERAANEFADEEEEKA